MIAKSILFSNMISTIPTIRIILVTDEPVIFPKVRPRYFLHTATIPILYSGREVPRAIIVEPRTDCPIPVESAIITSESTMNFALIITIIVPMRVILAVFDKNLNYLILWIDHFLISHVECSVSHIPTSGHSFLCTAPLIHNPTCPVGNSNVFLSVLEIASVIVLLDSAETKSSLVPTMFRTGMLIFFRSITSFPTVILFWISKLFL